MKDRPSALRALSALIESLPDEITVVVKNGQTQARLVLPPADSSAGPSGPSGPSGPAIDPGWWHSPDYREVRWRGNFFRFSKLRAAVVARLDLAATEGDPDVPQSEILRAIGSEGTRLSELFKEGDGKRAWMTLVIQGEQPGLYRLADINGPPALVDVESFRHSPDFREVHWHGHRFRFSKTQAAIVDLLQWARSGGEPDVDQKEILQRVGSEATRLVELFRRGDGARAWNLFIVQGAFPGSYRLADRPPAEGQL